MKLYCSKCGHPNSYTSQKPNFCINCGTNFATGEAPQQAVSSNVNKEKLEDLVEIEEDDFIAGDITELDVEIEGYTKTGVTLGQVIDNAARSPDEINKPATQKGKRKRMSKKAMQEENNKVIEEFKREAGTTGRSRPDA